MTNQVDSTGIKFSGNWNKSGVALQIFGNIGKNAGDVAEDLQKLVGQFRLA